MSLEKFVNPRHYCLKADISRYAKKRQASATALPKGL